MQAISKAYALALLKVGSKSAAKMAMTAITASSSIKVNALRLCFGDGFTRVRCLKPPGWGSPCGNTSGSCSLQHVAVILLSVHLIVFLYPTLSSEPASWSGHGNCECECIRRGGIAVRVVPVVMLHYKE